MKRNVVLTLLVMLAVALGVRAEGQADPRVEKQLQALGLKYQVDKDGDYKLVFQAGDNRTQVVFINSATNKVSGVEIREIWSPAYVGKEPPSGELLQKVLEDSQKRTLGSWQLMVNKDRSQFVLNYAVKLPVEGDDALVKVACGVCAQTADKLENEISGKDDL